MENLTLTRLGGLILSSVVLLTTPALLRAAAAEQAHDHAHDQNHSHSHVHAHEHEHEDRRIYDGYFDDIEVRARPLADYEGDWQSVFPYLEDGTLDPVMADKASSGDQTAEEYRTYYQTGYATDTNRITIEGDRVTFHQGDNRVSGTYAEDGHEILTYARGNRGVRYVFEKTGGDGEAPDVIQFSDHRIAPAKTGHFHLYWGDDRAALLDEVTNWPTYYPAEMTGDQIVAEMLAH